MYFLNHMNTMLNFMNIYFNRVTIVFETREHFLNDKLFISQHEWF
jgi:hypothetical protein